MARKKENPQKAAMREMMRDYLKNNDISIKDGTDVNNIIIITTMSCVLPLKNLRMCNTIMYVRILIIIIKRLSRLAMEADASVAKIRSKCYKNA